MGRSKKLNGETTNEKILGKLPKVKSNFGNLDFDEDDIDGISILSFKTFDDLKVYYPLDKIQPAHQQDLPKKEPAKKRKIKDKGEKNTKPKVKRKAVIKQPALNPSNLTQFDKSESEGEDVVQKSLFVKSEESPPPSPLTEIPEMSLPDNKTATTASTPISTTPTIKSEGCSTSSTTLSTSSATTPSVLLSTITPKVAVATSDIAATVTTCGSGSPIYQPSTQHIRIPSAGHPAAAAVAAAAAAATTSKHNTPPPFNRPPSISITGGHHLPTPPTTSQAQFYHGLHRHPVASHGLPFHFGANQQHPHDSRATAEMAAAAEMKMNIAKYDPRYLLQNGRLPNPGDLSAAEHMKLREDYNRYLLSRSISGTRPLFPTTAPSARPPPTPPNNPPIIPGQQGPPIRHSSEPAGAQADRGGHTTIKRRREKKWNSIHVYIAKMIYEDQQHKKTKDPLNAASANGEAARSFLGTGPPKRADMMREFPPFPGIHNMPPTPGTPFPPSANSPFSSNVHHGHPGLGGLRGIPGLSALGNRFPGPQIRPHYPPGLGGLHPGFDPLRHPSLPHYELSRLEQERIQREIAAHRNSELLSRSMYENALRQREHDLHTPHVNIHEHLKSRELMERLHAEEQRKRLASGEAQKMLNPSLANLYMHPQHLQALKYPPVNPNSHLAQFPHLFNQLDPRNSARYSHLISQQPKGPE